MLEKVTNFIVDYLDHSRNLDKTDSAYLNFGLKLIFITVSELLVMFLIAYFLNIFWPVVISTVSFLIIRPYAGGVHLPGYLSCLVVTLIVFLALGLLTTVVEINTISMLLIILFVSIPGFYMINKYAPADTEIIPINDPEQRKRLKSKAKNILIIWTITAITLTFILENYLNLILASSLGILSQLISTHPIFFHLVKKYLPEHD